MPRYLLMYCTQPLSQLIVHVPTNKPASCTHALPNSAFKHIAIRTTEIQLRQPSQVSQCRCQSLRAIHTQGIAWYDTHMIYLLACALACSFARSLIYDRATNKQTNKPRSCMHALPNPAFTNYHTHHSDKDQSTESNNSVPVPEPLHPPHPCHCLVPWSNKMQQRHNRHTHLVFTSGTSRIHALTCSLTLSFTQRPTNKQTPCTHVRANPTFTHIVILTTKR